MSWPPLDLPIRPPFPPVEARTQAELPEGPGWLLEPKWDGFRCLAFRDGDRVALQSKAGQPLHRYFPELVQALLALPARRFVLDGEIAVPVGDGFSFDALLQRIHPAESRVRRLSAETPAVYRVFDLLVDGEGRAWDRAPLADRRPALDAFAAATFPSGGRVHLSPATTDRALVEAWRRELRGHGIDGIVAKRLERPYESGERAMVKVKWLRTADCVVGGFRYAEKGGVVGSLLLGLYDDAGLLHHVGFCSGLKDADRPDLTRRLEALRRAPGFTGNAPGGPSRWSTERSAAWVPLDPVLVVEVGFDHWSEGRFRHGTRLLRWRSDKAPAQCTTAQVQGASPPARG